MSTLLRLEKISRNICCPRWYSVMTVLILIELTCTSLKAHSVLRQLLRHINASKRIPAGPKKGDKLSNKISEGREARAVLIVNNNNLSLSDTVTRVDHGDLATTNTPCSHLTLISYHGKVWHQAKTQRRKNSLRQVFCGDSDHYLYDPR